MGWGGEREGEGGKERGKGGRGGGEAVASDRMASQQRDGGAAGEQHHLTRDGCGEVRMAVTRARERAGRLLRALRLRQQQARAAAELWYVTG